MSVRCVARGAMVTALTAIILAIVTAGVRAQGSDELDALR
jgi:hypothetical protein